jgi:hypothetical protein
MAKMKPRVSKANAVTQGAPANFTLITLPDNCWGMNMNYGLIKLGQTADVTITVTADGSSMAPIFALYRGWDTGAGASRHDAIFFGENNPSAHHGIDLSGRCATRPPNHPQQDFQGTGGWEL